MARDTVSNALGTLLAGLILFLGATAVGALKDVDTQAIVSAGIGVLGTVVALGASLRSGRDALRAQERASETLAEAVQALVDAGIAERVDPDEDAPGHS